MNFGKLTRNWSL